MTDSELREAAAASGLRWLPNPAGPGVIVQRPTPEGAWVDAGGPLRRPQAVAFMDGWAAHAALQAAQEREA